MNNIQFIPDSQKKHFSFGSTKQSLSFTSIVIILGALVGGYVAALVGIQYGVLERQISELETEIDQVNSEIGDLYVPPNLAGTIGIASDIVVDLVSVDTILADVQTLYLPQLRVQDVSYTKETQMLRLTVELDSLEAVGAQVERLKESRYVAAAEYEDAQSLEEREGTRAALILSLK